MIQKDCLKGGYCEFTVLSSKFYDARVLMRGTLVYKCSKCKTVYAKSPNGRIAKLPQSQRCTTAEIIQTKLTWTQIQDEYDYIKRVNSVGIIRQSLKGLLDREILNEQLNKEVKGLLAVLEPHLVNIATYLERKYEADYNTIVKNNSLVILDNICTYIYILFVFNDLHAAPNKMTEYMQDESYPYIMKMKNQSDNIVNYFRMIKPESF